MTPVTLPPRDRAVDLAGYDGLRCYVGDLHNHCGISYGHGSIEDAFANAALQLDFATVTGHAWWPDIPADVPELADTVAYHRAGFERLARGWEHVQDVTAGVHRDGEFVSFLSFEWHSSAYGDHCVYYNGDHGPIIRAEDLGHLRAELRRLRAGGLEGMALPHHVGYPQGFRGANWDAFTPEFTPMVEMMSMHGCAESDDAPRPYLHTMGPRHSANTALAGLTRGLRFGLIGSTDHHSAHPGSFGYGRVAAWATDLTRDALWEAFWRRRVYALTGDPIVVGFTVDGAPMGSELEHRPERQVHATVRGEAPLDYVEVVRNGRVVHRENGPRAAGSGNGPAGGRFRGMVPFSVGWGAPGAEVDWDVELRVDGGSLDTVMPRLHGEDIVAPAEHPPERFRFSRWGRRDPASVWLSTVTKGNPNVVTDGTQGLNLHVTGDDRTAIIATVNGVSSTHRLGDLRAGSHDRYLRPYVSPAYRLGRAVADDETVATVDLTDTGDPGDWYYLRVRQTNDQWAWTSPVWVGDTGARAH